jgi:hypothetical protein
LFTDDPGCLGRIYTTPYLRQNPECAFVLVSAELTEGLEEFPWSATHQERGVVGYCLGTPDSAEFYRRYTEEAIPSLRAAFPRPVAPASEWSPSQHVHNSYHSDERFPTELGGLRTAPFVPSWVTDCFPAHLHIDILPHVQRGGWGRKLIETQLRRLTDLGASGVHLNSTRRWALWRLRALTANSSSAAPSPAPTRSGQPWAPPPPPLRALAASVW